MIKNYKIGFTLDGKPEEISYLCSLEMNNALASIVIFATKFGRVYTKKRERAENEFAEKGEVEFNGKFSDIKFEKLQEANMKSPA